MSIFVTEIYSRRTFEELWNWILKTNAPSINTSSYGPDAKSFAVYNSSQQKCIIDQMLYTSQPFKFFHTLILNEVQVHSVISSLVLRIFNQILASLPCDSNYSSLHDVVTKYWYTLKLRRKVSILYLHTVLGCKNTSVMRQWFSHPLN